MKPHNVCFPHGWYRGAYNYGEEYRLPEEITAYVVMTRNRKGKEIDRTFYDKTSAHNYSAALKDKGVEHRIFLSVLTKATEITTNATEYLSTDYEYGCVDDENEAFPLVDRLTARPMLFRGFLPSDEYPEGVDFGTPL